MTPLSINAIREEEMAAVTISALQDPVAIVHVPVALAAAYCTKLYWTVDRAETDSAEFFNLTSNRIALFVNADLAEDEWGATAPPVHVNGPWRVFEISSGDPNEESNYDSPHLRHVSAPLAAAGVSILYQSSYFTDFLLVKSSDFDKAASIFKGCGWHVDSQVSSPTRRRSIAIPPDNTLSLLVDAALTAPLPPVAEITVLPAPLACVGLSGDAESRQGVSERLKKLLVWPERTMLQIDAGRERARTVEKEREEARRSWRDWQAAKKEQEEAPASPTTKRHRPFISYTRTEDGASVLTETRVLRALLTREERADLSIPELDGDGGSEWSVDEEEPTHTRAPASRGSGGDSPPLSAHSSHLLRFSLPHSPSSGALPIHWAGSPPTTPTTSRFERVGRLTPIVGGVPSTSRGTSGPGHARTRSEGWSLQLSKPNNRRLSENLLNSRPRVDQDSHVDDETVVPAEDGKAEETDEEEEEDKGSRSMRCLQLDLRAVSVSSPSFKAEDGASYHLDKSGLVTRFSDLLRRGGVRMLYSSTTHTANILVEGRDVAKAEWLLRSSADV